MKENGPCVTPTCGKNGSLVCPTCKKLGIPSLKSTFCSQQCFKLYWPSHKALHNMFTQTLSEEQTRDERASSFNGYIFTGKLRPGAVSKTVKVPQTVDQPDYADTGIPESEQRARRESKGIPVYTPEQIKGIREACRLGREVLDIAGQALCPGITSDAIDKIVHKACMDRGCYPSPLNYYHFPKSVCISVNEVICHGIPDSRLFEDGDIVNLDVTVYKNGYHGDLNETFLVGSVDEEGVHLVISTFESLATAARMIHPGTVFRELGKHVSAVTNAAGFFVVKAYCGHDIPYYAKNKAVGIMKPGMIFTIEPMINAGTWRDQTWPDEWTSVTRDGLRSAQFEHTFLVTETGYEILTARENEPVMEWSQAKLQRPLEAGCFESNDQIIKIV